MWRIYHQTDDKRLILGIRPEPGQPPIEGAQFQRIVRLFGEPALVRRNEITTAHALILKECGRHLSWAYALKHLPPDNWMLHYNDQDEIDYLLHYLDHPLAPSRHQAWAMGREDVVAHQKAAALCETTHFYAKYTDIEIDLNFVVNHNSPKVMRTQPIVWIGYDADGRYFQHACLWPRRLWDDGPRAEDGFPVSDEIIYRQVPLVAEREAAGETKHVRDRLNEMDRGRDDFQIRFGCYDAEDGSVVWPAGNIGLQPIAMKRGPI